MYRLIPARTRSVWSMGTSTSHIALARLRSGEYQGAAALGMFLRMATPNLGFLRMLGVDHYEFRPKGWY